MRLLVATQDRRGYATEIVRLRVRKREVTRLRRLLDTWQPLILHIDENTYYVIEGRSSGGSVK